MKKQLHQLFLAGLALSLPVALAPAVSRADCGPWQIVDSPNPGQTFNNLFGMKAIAVDDVWSVGYHENNGVDPGYRTLALHWDGTEWSVVPTPRPHRYSGLSGVAALAPDDVWAVGYQGKWGVDFEGEQPLSMHWDGAEWTVVSTPTFAQRYINHLRGVAALAPDDVWAAGQTGWPTPDLTLI
jgi:hypothetical protein